MSAVPFFYEYLFIIIFILLVSVSAVVLSCVLCAGIKHLHVFPFVSQFCLMAHDMEVGLAEGLAAVTAAAAYSSSSSRQGSAAAESDDEGQEEEQQSAAAAAAATVRHGKTWQLASPPLAMRLCTPS